MKVHLFLLSFCLCMISLTAQNAQPDSTTSIENADVFQRKSTEFGISLFNNIAESKADKNFIFSPLDAQISLSMMGNLFTPNRAKSVSSIFGCANINELNSKNRQIIIQLTDTAHSEYINPTKISNCIWFNTGV